MDDARKLVPVVQQIVDLATPIAEAVELEGDFTIALTIKRRKGSVTADANLNLGRRR